MGDLLQKSLWRTSLLLGYVILGGGLFYYIEKKAESNEKNYRRLSRELWQNFTVQLNISMTENDFNRFIQRAFEIVQVGKKADWSFLSSLSFSMTTLATVGYGHITPETPLGQIATVLYCFVGLPLSMLTLKTLGEGVSKMVNNFVYTVETRFLYIRRPRKIKIKSFLMTFALTILTLCIGGVAEVYLEGWTFVEGFYAWFATLSTLGYGDYVPGWSLLLKAEKSLDSKISLGLIIFASALPSMAALSVVAGVLNSLVEAIDEFKINLKDRYKLSTLQDEESGIGPGNLRYGDSKMGIRRARSATF